MLEDLGLHLDGRLTQLSSPFTLDQLQTRGRLFWSAYLWDKMISLYLGRTPKLALSAFAPSSHFEEEFEEEELWQPLGNRLDDFPPFTPTETYATEVFTFNCRLSVITNDILLHDAGQLESGSIPASRARLVGWRTSLPEYLWLDPHHTGPPPPSHVINLNCLYHMVMILLDRRQYPGTIRRSSIESALEITRLAQLSHRAFRDRQGVLSHCYCIYTAATVFMYRLRYGHVSAQGQVTKDETCIITALSWCIQRLQETMVTMAAMRIPVAVLQEQLSALPKDTTAELLLLQPTMEEPPENLAPPDFTRSVMLEQPPVSSFFPLPEPVNQVQATVNEIANTDFSQEFWSWLGGGELSRSEFIS